LLPLVGQTAGVEVEAFLFAAAFAPEAEAAAAEC
jgi:hypothetical protein